MRVDAQFLVHRTTDQDLAAQQFATRIANKYLAQTSTDFSPGINFYVTGHSLGGHNALIGAATLMRNEIANAALKEVHTWNGLGMAWPSENAVKENPNLGPAREWLKKADELLKENAGKITNHRNLNDPISNYGESYGKIIANDALYSNPIPCPSGLPTCDAHRLQSFGPNYKIDIPTLSSKLNDYKTGKVIDSDIAQQVGQQEVYGDYYNGDPFGLTHVF